jgi:hypothetical protein
MLLDCTGSRINGYYPTNALKIKERRFKLKNIAVEYSMAMIFLLAE